MIKLLPYIWILLLCACSLEPKDTEAPMDLIPHDSMVLLVHDLSILESHIQQKFIQLERYAKIMRVSGDSLLGKNNISRQRYESSLLYYSKKPEILSAIYDSVLVRLEGVSAMDDGLPQY
jgi:hypothetical protein